MVEFDAIDDFEGVSADYRGSRIEGLLLCFEMFLVSMSMYFIYRADDLISWENRQQFQWFSSSFVTHALFFFFAFCFFVCFFFAVLRCFFFVLCLFFLALVFFLMRGFLFDVFVCVLRAFVICGRTVCVCVCTHINSNKHKTRL